MAEGRSIFVIKPSGRLDLENCHYNLEKMVDAQEIYAEFDPRDKYCLFNFGMLFALLHYLESKKIILTKEITPTPEKSFQNVLLDVSKNGTKALPSYVIDEKKAFLISPVRKTNNDLAIYLRKFKHYLLQEGLYKLVHYPLDDTNQEDLIGTRICVDNLEAEASSGTIKIFYLKESQGSKGSIFDIGMDFALKYHLDPLICPGKRREISIINKHQIKEENDYAKFLLALENES